MDETSSLPPLLSGIYQHYKGPYYLVLGYGHDANDEDRTTVHYLGLQLSDAHNGPRLATRTALSNDPKVDAFWDMVHQDGSKCTHLESTDNPPDHTLIRPRFDYVGPSWEI